MILITAVKEIVSHLLAYVNCNCGTERTWNSKETVTVEHRGHGIVWKL